MEEDKEVYNKKMIHPKEEEAQQLQKVAKFTNLKKELELKVREVRF